MSQTTRIYTLSLEEYRCGEEYEGGRNDIFEDPVDFRSYDPQLFNHRVKLPIPDDLDVEEKETPQPRRRSPAPAPSRKPAPAARARRRLHPMFFVGIGLMAFVLLWVGVTQAFIWGNNVLNGLRYSYPRTFQMDVVVGHQDSASAPSHFFAINLRGQIEIIDKRVIDHLACFLEATYESRRTLQPCLIAERESAQKKPCKPGKEVNT